MLYQEFMPHSFWVLLLVIFGHTAQAYETDQYTVPKSPLADVGEDLSRYFYSQIQSSIKEINQDRVSLPGKISALKLERATQSAPQASPSYEEEMKLSNEYLDRQIREFEERLQLIQTEAGLVKAIWQKFGMQITWQEQRDGVFGLPLTILNQQGNLKKGKPLSFDAGKFSIIYSFSGFHRLLNPTYFVFASTIKAFDVHFGVDKIGHIFNQGFQYYEIFQKNLTNGKDQKQSLKAAVDWGVGTEDGIFGVFVDGVYSNADLAANIAGFLFYQNLFQEVQFGPQHLAPKLIRHSDGKISWNPDADIKAEELIKPFITQHLNESLNPSQLERLQRGIVKRAIQSRCSSWKAYYQLYNQEPVRALTSELKSFYEINYGHKDEYTLKIEEICWP